MAVIAIGAPGQQGREPPPDQGGQAPPDFGQGRRPGERGRGPRGDEHGRFGGGTFGTISQLEGNTLTVKTPKNDIVKVKITGETRFFKDRDEADRKDFKVGDSVMVRGDRDEKTGVVQAMFIVHANEMVQRAKEDLGKKYITGEVKAIDETKLTVLRPDGQTQVIEVDENTSFRHNRQSITLADVKVGDGVMGRGELKNGTFFPAVLNVVDVNQVRGGFVYFEGRHDRPERANEQPPK